MIKEVSDILSIYNTILENKIALLSEADISGIDELVYNPATKAGGTIGHGYDNGRRVTGITWKNHDNHLHIGFTNKQVAMEVIDKADQMGLKTTENPYAKRDPNGKVDQVHSSTSFHYKMFPGEPKVGAAVDISGDPKKITELIKWIENEYAGRSYPTQQTVDISQSKDSKSNAPKGSETDTSSDLSTLSTSTTSGDKDPYLTKVMTNLGKSMLGLKESFGNDIVEKSGTLKIPSKSNSIIYSPVDGVVDNKKYSIGCKGEVTIKLNSGEGYLQFCNITKPSVRDGEKIKIGKVLGKTNDDVEVVLFDRSYQRKRLTDDQFDTPFFKDKTKSKTKGKDKDKDYTDFKIKQRPETAYTDPLVALIPELIGRLLKDRKPGEPWIANAIAKPFEKIGKAIGTNKQDEKNLTEEIQRIKKLL